ncbi:hypothetical protein EDD21DRAFT_376545 [Dissophora ornata]|nr:hypothetical protein BGZ58_003501 [Dissophora ornata]KAI8600677.1 hypothetical protein EDD21DRAFT_376545 [Dissophora ornata]
MVSTPSSMGSHGSPDSSPTIDSSYHHHQQQLQQQGQTNCDSLENPTESTCSITSTIALTANPTKINTTKSTTMRAFSKTEPSAEPLETTTPTTTSNMCRLPRRRQNDNNGNTNSNNNGSKHKSRENRIREQLEALRILYSRLDLMAVGAWLLVPSMIVYHASALMAVQEQSTTVTEGSNYSAGQSGVLESIRPWVMAIGVFTPLVAYKALTRLERARAARKGHAAAAACTGCPYARLKNRLTARFRQTESLPSSTQDVLGSKTTEPSQARVGPKPKTLLLRSVGLWTVLIIMSTRFGLNHSVSFMSSSPPSMSVEGSGEGSYWGIHPMDVPASAPSFIPESSSSVNRGEDYPMLVMDWTEEQQDQQEDIQYPAIGLEDEEEDFDDDEASWSEMTPETVEAMVRAAENDDVMDSEWVMPEQLDTYSDDDDDSLKYTAGEAADIEEEDPVSALRDFWDAIEEAVVEEAENIVADHDDQFSSPTLPDPTTPQPFPEEDPLNNDWRDRSNTDDNEVEFGSVFEYIPGWTEAMLFAVSICFGTAALSIRLARQQVYELASKLRNELHTIDPNEETKTVGYPWVRMLLAIAVSVLTTCWMLHSQIWDLSMLLFAYVGIVLMIATYVWIPEDIEDLSIYPVTDSDVVPEDDDDNQSGEACYIAIDEKNSI